MSISARRPSGLRWRRSLILLLAALALSFISIGHATASQVTGIVMVSDGHGQHEHDSDTRHGTNVHEDHSHAYSLPCAQVGQESRCGAAKGLAVDAAQSRRQSSRPERPPRIQLN